MISQVLVFMGMDQQCVTVSQIMPISSTGGTVGFPIPTRNMDVFKNNDVLQCIRT